MTAILEPGFVSAVANHLWQSTLCLAAASALTLAVRRDRARVRHGIWLACSIKFLVPFALLVNIGSHFAPAHSAHAQTLIITVVEQAGQPFSMRPSRASANTGPAGSFLPALLGIAWLCGSAVLLALWLVRWRRLSSVVAAATPQCDGREVSLLRALEEKAEEESTGEGWQIRFLVSRASLEPGIFGIVRPVLLWPANFSAHLSDAELKAILAHELGHVRYRDNLAATLHMLVEALFWFHPLVWWLGTRLIHERERACDEEVVLLGAEPQVYAESILKASRFCVESPLACVTGVTGSNLERRIVRIMTQQLAGKLNLGRKLLLAASGIAVVTAPFVFGLWRSTTVSAQRSELPAAPFLSGPIAPTSQVPAPAFASVSVRPSQSATDQKFMHSTTSGAGNLKMTNFGLKDLIEEAYGVKDYQLTDVPDWVNTARYDIEANETDSLIAEAQQLNMAQQAAERRLMLQAILTEKFNLQVSRATKVMPVYALVVGEDGPKLTSSTTQQVAPNGEKMISVKTMFKTDQAGITMTGPLGVLSDMLSRYLECAVLDKTELGDNSYDISLQWTPGENKLETVAPVLQEKLGLKLEPQQAPVEMVAIERIDHPQHN